MDRKFEVQWNAWAQENKGVNHRGQHRISLCNLQTYSPLHPFIQACIDAHRPQKSEVSRKNEEDVTVNEQLNLEYAQLRASTLLAIPWGLKVPRGAYSIVSLCWDDWRKCFLEASNHPNPQSVKIIPHPWSSSQHQTGSSRMGEMSSTTLRKQEWKGATRASVVVNQELDKRKRTHWGAGRKKNIRSSKSWQWEQLTWISSCKLLPACDFTWPLNSKRAKWADIIKESSVLFPK